MCSASDGSQFDASCAHADQLRIADIDRRPQPAVRFHAWCVAGSIISIADRTGAGQVIRGWDQVHLTSLCAQLTTLQGLLDM